jgi:flagellar biosynthesis protein FlhF
MALRIRKYTGIAGRADELVAQAHSELGDAIEVHRRTFKRGRVFGLLGGVQMVEIIAMAEYAAPESAEDRLPRDETRIELAADETTPIEVVFEVEEETVEPSPTPSTSETTEELIPLEIPPSPQQESDNPEVVIIRDELAELGLEEEATRRERAGMTEGKPRPSELIPGVPVGLQDRFFKLLACGLSVDDARTMLEQTCPENGRESVPEDDWWRRVCRSTFAEILLDGGISVTGGDSTPKVVVFIGPTGVGKTTTMAKVAAVLTLQKDLRIGLISLDNYRVAAPEQLKTYADIMGLSFDVAFTADEYRRIVNRQRYQDVILVDTAGRSPFNQRYVEELREMLMRNPPDEVHLVLSANMGGLDISAAVEKFRPLKFTHLDVTKIDESPHPGGIFNITRKAMVPVRYFTVGQRVPEDIREANLAFARSFCDNGGRI